MNVVFNESINLSQTGLLYNPQLKSAQTVEKLFVVRQKQFELLLNKISQEKENSVPLHYLVIGQRGMGKTMLLRRIEVELHKDQYRSRFIPLLYREEQYNIKDLAEFWLNTLDALADSLQVEKYESQMAEELVEDIDKTIRELSKETPEIIMKTAYKYLMDICRDLCRRPVLLIDNINMVFDRLDSDKENKAEQWTLQKMLSENGAPIVISGSVSIFDNINNSGMPFYNFFHIQHLKKLKYEEFNKLLISLATITKSDKTIFYSIQKSVSRQKSLLELTGGSPRLTVMLFAQLAKGFSSGIYDDLEVLVDAITPLYKARFEELSVQQQQILDAVALNWHAIPLNELVKVTRLQSNQLSPQLKRMADDGWIETTRAYNAKGSACFISERFFNIYYLIRNSSRRYKDKIFCLSRFLECFYGKEDLERISTTLLKEDIYSSEQMLLHLAVSRVEGLKSSLRKKIQGKTIETFLNNEKLSKEFDIDDKQFLSEGVSLFKSKNYGEAVKCFNKVLTANIDDEYTLYFKGECLYKLKKHEEALVCYEKIIEQDPIDDWYWYCKGDVLMELKRHEEALLCYEKSIELSPIDDWYWYSKGDALNTLGRCEEAILCFDECLKINQKNDLYWFNKGAALNTLRRYEEAILCFDKCIELNPKKTAFWLGKGSALIMLKQFADSISCYEQAIKLNHKNSTAILGSAICLYNMKQYKKSITFLDKAIKTNANNERSWYLKSVCLFYLQQFEEAIVCLDRAIELNPDDFHFWNNKGYALIQLKKYTDAVSAYEKSIIINPEQLFPKMFLLFLYRDKLNEMNRAMEIINSISEEEINKSHYFASCYWLNKALFELYNQNKGLARDYISKAFKIFLDDGKIMTIAGDNWWARFGGVVIKLGCGEWLLTILKERKYNNILAPYYTAIQAMEIEQQDSKNGKENSEIYLKNRAVEISVPAKKIIEKIKNI